MNKSDEVVRGAVTLTLLRSGAGLGASEIPRSYTEVKLLLDFVSIWVFV